MRELEIIDSDRPLSAVEISEFEAESGIKIPGAYKEFLLAHNGGIPSPDSFAVEMEPRPHNHNKSTQNFLSSVEYFYALDNNNVSVLSKRHFIDDGRVQEGMFPFAYCGGDLICISTRQESFDQIYYWFSDEEYDERAEGDRNLYFLARDFNEFLEKLN